MDVLFVVRLVSHIVITINVIHIVRQVVTYNVRCVLCVMMNLFLMLLALVVHSTQLVHVEEPTQQEAILVHMRVICYNQNPLAVFSQGGFLMADILSFYF